LVTSVVIVIVFVEFVLFAGAVAQLVKLRHLFRRQPLLQFGHNLFCRPAVTGIPVSAVLIASVASP